MFVSRATNALFDLFSGENAFSDIFFSQKISVLKLKKLKEALMLMKMTQCGLIMGMAGGM
jgi:hypothetical protein